VVIVIGRRQSPLFSEVFYFIERLVELPSPGRGQSIVLLLRILEPLAELIKLAKKFIPLLLEQVQQ